MTDPSPSTLDTVFSLLSSSRRRYLLWYFLENDVGTVDHLSRQIAAREAGTPAEDVADDERRAVAVSLAHDHLPRLADHGLLEYDPRTGDAASTSTLETLRPVLVHARDREGDTALSDRPSRAVLYSTPSASGEPSSGDD